MTWVGLTVEQYSIDALIGEGSFAWLYRGVNESGEKRAFKVAKPNEFVLNGMATGFICTKALKFRTNGIGEAIPDAKELLNLEFDKFSKRDLPCLPKYFSKVAHEGLAYLQMELLEGATLLQLIENGQFGLSSPALTAVRQAGLALSALFESGLPYHGDLTPGNIFLSQGGVKILDPGHFGELKMADGTIKGVFVTTPEFYPLLRPDDVLALGLMAWHAVMGKPLIERDSRYLCGVDTNQIISREVYDWLDSQENMGNFYLSALRALFLPRDKGCSPEQEAILLKALRFALNSEGKIVRDPGYESPVQLAEALSIFGA
ncbi:MAG: hypothetical protein K2Y39_06320 [Candidatus Obscuribacterales bacterium]|nr:hypothetical protein [Candidatus Obscuribacterales bacterium]